MFWVYRSTQLGHLICNVVLLECGFFQISDASLKGHLFAWSSWSSTVGGQRRHNLVRGRPEFCNFLNRSKILILIKDFDSKNSRMANPVASSQCLSVLFSLCLVCIKHSAAVVEHGKVWADSVGLRYVPSRTKVCNAEELPQGKAALEQSRSFTFLS